MKTISVRIDDESHVRLKIYAAQQGKTITEIVTGLVKEAVKVKKEQPR